MTNANTIIYNGVEYTAKKKKKTGHFRHFLVLCLCLVVFPPMAAFYLIFWIACCFERKR